jgi:excisionase family DNA binding protein
MAEPRTYPPLDPDVFGPTRPEPDYTAAAPYVTAREIAQVLGVHHVTVLRWAREGTLPSVRVGGRVRFDPVAVAAAATRRRAKPRAVMPIEPTDRGWERPGFHAPMTEEEAADAIRQHEAYLANPADVRERTPDDPVLAAHDEQQAAHLIATLRAMSPDQRAEVRRLLDEADARRPRTTVSPKPRRTAGGAR